MVSPSFTDTASAPVSDLSPSTSSDNYDAYAAAPAADTQSDGYDAPYTDAPSDQPTADPTPAPAPHWEDTDGYKAQQAEIADLKAWRDSQATTKADAEYQQYVQAGTTFMNTVFQKINEGMPLEPNEMQGMQHYAAKGIHQSSPQFEQSVKAFDAEYTVKDLRSYAYDTLVDTLPANTTLATLKQMRDSLLAPVPQGMQSIDPRRGTYKDIIKQEAQRQAKEQFEKNRRSNAPGERVEGTGSGSGSYMSDQEWMNRWSNGDIRSTAENAQKALQLQNRGVMARSR